MRKRVTELVYVSKREKNSDSPKKRKINFSIANYFTQVYSLMYGRSKKNHWR